MKHLLVKITLLIILGIMAISPEAVAQNAVTTLMNKANQAYDKQHYKKAIQLYDSIIKEGWVSPKLYYNLGDAYFRTKNLPSAILYFEKAKKLDPNNSDIKYNLGIANSMIIDKIEKVPHFFLTRWWNYFYNLFNSNTWTIIFIISFAILVFFVGWFILAQSRKSRMWSFFLGIIFFFISIVVFGLASQRNYYTRNQKEAIVFSPSISVKSSPSPNSVDLFVIHDGTKVKLLDNVDGWYKIKISNGSIGWIPDNSVRKI